MKQIAISELKHDLHSILKMADVAPITITKRGTPAFVIMLESDYNKLVKQKAEMEEKCLK